MSTYLCVSPAGPGRWEVAGSEDPTPTLQREGLVSVIYGAFEPDAPSIPADGALALFFVASPRKMLNRAMVELGSETKRAMFITHGLACVGIVGQSVTELTDLALALAPDVTGYEVWPLVDSHLEISDLIFQEPEQVEFVAPTVVSEDGLPYEAAAQVRQLNANLQMTASKAARYAPELLPTLHSVANLADDTVTSTSTALEGGVGEIERTQLKHDATALLVELNAGLTMLYSQLITGGVPLVRESYPVAEYSLLGIGSAVRALIAVYAHLNTAFQKSNYLARIDAAYTTAAPFPVWIHRLDLDYTEWETSTLRLSDLPDVAMAPENYRQHLLYFSSRYGFHETLTTMSASWQCVHASATRAWNLLTLSHEFVHAHVREIVDVTLARYSYAELAELATNDNPQNPWDSLSMVFIGAMRYGDRVRNDLPMISGKNPNYRSPGWQKETDAATIEYLIEGRARRVLQELIVHSLDYLYVYDGRAELYLASIWGSWSYVQSIMKRLHHYCLRSLVALSASDATHTDDKTAYRVAEDRLARVLEALAAEDDGGVASRALEYLTSDPGKYRLQAEFQQAYYVARFTRSLLFDRRISGELRTDSTTEVLNGVPSYPFGPGEYPAEAIESPTEFLLDRFADFSAGRSVDQIQFESLWQLLVLADSGRQEVLAPTT